MTVYYVSTQGNDSDKGMQNAPWRHIQYACAQLKPGDTLRILPGAYDENILLCTDKNSVPGGIRQFATVVQSGTNRQKIVIQADDADNKPRITGSQRFGRLLAYNVSHWTIDGLLAENFDGSGIIFAALNSPQSGVTIRNCTLRNMWGGSDSPGNGIGKYGICVIGKNHQTFSDVLIENNILDHIVPGDEFRGNECLDVAGSIDGAIVQNNFLRECHRIAINILGADGTAGGLTIKNGQPSNVVVRHNRIVNMLRKANSTGPDKIGTPIYCDRAGENILIENNYIEQSNGWNSCTALLIGYEPGWDDNTKSTRYVIVRNNVAVNCRLGYQLGYGSARFYDWTVEDVALVHNVMLNQQPHPNTYAGMTFGHGVRFRIKNNVFVNRSTRDAVRTRDQLNSQSEKVGMQSSPATWLMDGNLWQTTGGARWEFGQEAFYYSLKELQQAGQERNGQIGVPVFVDEADDDYRLAPSSPGQGDATPLTQAVEAERNARVLQTEESVYFWPGDIIVINGITAVIERIDRTTNSLYLDRGMSWEKGAGVYYQYWGNAPSVGLTATQSGIVPVESLPTTIADLPEDAAIMAGAEVKFVAGFVGENLTYQWFSGDENLLEDSDTLVGTTTNVLHLKIVSSAQDGARYYCVASNSVGSARSRLAQLSVYEKNEESDVYERLIQRGLSVGVRFGAG